MSRLIDRLDMTLTVLTGPNQTNNETHNVVIISMFTEMFVPSETEYRPYMYVSVVVQIGI